MSQRPLEPIGNRLLASLPEDEMQRLRPHLEHISFTLGEVIYASGGQQSYIYFPTTAIILLLYLWRTARPPNRAVVQSAGDALRMTTKVLQAEFAHGGTFQRLLLRYTQALMTQMSQTAVCNRLHTVEQQLCRWLLLSRDRLNSDELVMT